MKTWPRTLIAAALLMVVFLFLHFRSEGEAVPLRKPLDQLPTAFGEWRGREATVFGLDILEVLQSTDYVMRRYVDPTGRSLWLFVGYWATQRKGAQPHSPRNCLPGSGWEPLEGSRLTIPVATGQREIVVNRLVIQKDREQQVVLYWYDAQGKVVAGEAAARIEMVKSAMTRNRTDGALVRVASPVYGSAAETTAWLTRYVQAMFPVLGQFLPGRF